MKLPRENLLEALETVKAAVVTKSLVDELCHVWFNGKTLLAYNDTTLGIDVPFQSELRGGLRGTVLMGLLGSSRAKELELTEVDDQLQLKAGATKVKLPLLPPEKVVWKFPKVTDEEAFPLNKALLEAVKLSLVSASDPEPSTPEKLGVTFVLGSDGLNIYTTDSKTISWVQCAAPKGYKHKRITIPTPFWEEVLKTCKDGGHFWVNPDYVIARSKNNVRIFAKTVQVERPLDFDAAIARNLPKKWLSKANPLPKRLPLAIERACILLDGHPGETVSMDVAGDVLRLEAKVPYGELRDSVKLEKPHDVVRGSFEPGIIRRCLSQVDAFMVTENCVLFFGGERYVYLVAALD